MKIRTLYFKVKDIEGAAKFWEQLLQVTPHKNFDTWREFWCGNIRFGLLSEDFEDDFRGSSCVPVFEFEDEVLEGVYCTREAIGCPDRRRWFGESAIEISRLPRSFRPRI